jgi:SnoaL-like domain
MASARAFTDEGARKHYSPDGEIVNGANGQKGRRQDMDLEARVKALEARL